MIPPDDDQVDDRAMRALPQAKRTMSRPLVTDSGPGLTNGSHAGLFPRLWRRLIDALWLRDAESWARRLDEDERKILEVQVVRARQKLESARLLWAHEQFVEGLRLAQESVVESLQAAALSAPTLTGATTGPRGAVRPRWADALEVLGVPDKDINQAIGVADGLTGSRPNQNKEVKPEDRHHFRTATRIAEMALDRLAPLVMPPRRIVMARWLRVFSLAAMLIIAGTIAVFVITGVDVRASASFSDKYEPRQAIDGNPGTEWLLPDHALGWIEFSFRPRTIKAVKLLNACNAPHFDRATGDFRVEAYLDKKLVHSSKHTFPKVDSQPEWMNIPVPPLRVDSVRVVIESKHKQSGGVAEIAFE